MQRSNDTQLGLYLIATWAKVCQAMGPEFGPYLPVVMPSLLATTGANPRVYLFTRQIQWTQRVWKRPKSAKDGRPSFSMVRRTAYGLSSWTKIARLSRHLSFIAPCSERLSPYLVQTLDVTLPFFRFYFHEGVRESWAMYVPRCFFQLFPANVFSA